MTILHPGRTAWAAAALALALAWAAPAAGYEAKDSDAFLFHAGTANIVMKGTNDLVDGAQYGGALRLGLFWTFFMQLGYGTVNYMDTVLLGGVQQDITFRTTGANAGLGFVIPIRAVQLGLLYVRNPDNKWEQEQRDTLTRAKIGVPISGSIDFDSYLAFARIGRWFEVGVRRDYIAKTDSLLTNSFGPYVAFVIPIR